MGTIGTILIAAIAFLSGAAQHIGTACLSTPPAAIRVTTNSGIDLGQATLRLALVNSPVC